MLRNTGVIAAVLAFCLAVAAARAVAQDFAPFVVKDIRVEGLQRTEPGTVFSYLPVKVGETMNEREGARRAARPVTPPVSSRTCASRSRARCWWSSCASGRRSPRSTSPA